MTELMEYLPFLIPLFLLQVSLALIALVHILKHPNYRFGNKMLWIPLVLLIQILGPILYFALGRGDE